MHPNRKFHISDGDAMARFVADQGFGVLVVATMEGLRAVHIPFLLAGDRVRFHISKGNVVHSTLIGGADALLAVNGPHAYVSPDWYGLDDRVPTWNYMAVELNGRVDPLEPDGLVELLDDLSELHEQKLAPKPGWTRDKMSGGRFEGLLKAISGFEMQVSAWRGTAKLDQDKSDDVRARLASALDKRGEYAMAALLRS